jgi:uncharacterized protein
MKNATTIAFILLLSVLAMISAKAQNIDNSSQSANLWRIEKDGKTSFILGTIHLGVGASKLFPPMVWSLLENSSKLVIETDVEAAAANPESLLMLPEGQSLQKLISKSAWLKLKSEIDFIPSYELNTMSPLFVAQLLQQQRMEKVKSKLIAEASAGMTPEIPMDLEILGRAKQGAISVGFLESVETHSLALQPAPAKLEEAIHQTEAEWEAATVKQIIALKVMIENYKAGKTSDLNAGIQGESSEKMESVLFERNRNWIPGIEKFHSDGQTFIAVGAAHLLGKEGILKLLRDRGFTIKKVITRGMCRNLYSAG